MTYHNDPKNEAAKRCLSLIDEGFPMHDVEAHAAKCPECGHVTVCACSEAAWSDMQPLVCACGATKCIVEDVHSYMRERFRYISYPGRDGGTS